MTDQTPRFVSWDRWDAEHRALLERVSELERFADRRRNAEAEDRAMLARIADLEQAAADAVKANRTRRDRLWLLVLGVTTGVVAPLLVTALITLLHIRSTR